MKCPSCNEEMWKMLDENREMLYLCQNKECEEFFVRMRVAKLGSRGDEEDE